MGSAAAAQSGGGLDRSVRTLDKQAPKAPQPSPEAQASNRLPRDPQLKNTVGLSFEIKPGNDLRVGARMSFRINARSPGYVLIFDIDATGRTTQVFPNVFSGALEGRNDENRISSGGFISVPEPGSRRYEFVTSPPSGIGMIVVVFSDRPLQVIDIPDVPADLVGRTGAAEFVPTAIAGLRFVPADGAADAKPPELSFAARYYLLR